MDVHLNGSGVLFASVNPYAGGIDLMDAYVLEGYWVEGYAEGDGGQSEAPPAEVNWPGTTIPRSQFKAMQRAALARALAEARREREETPEPQPVKKATRKAARRVLRIMAADGLLSSEALSGAEKPLAQAIAGTLSFQDLMSQFDAMLQEMEARQQAIDGQYEDEAIALLLMAA